MRTGYDVGAPRPTDMPKLDRTEGGRASAAVDNGPALSTQQDDRGSGRGPHGPRHKATTAIPSSEPRKLGTSNARL